MERSEPIPKARALRGSRELFASSRWTAWLVVVAISTVMVFTGHMDTIQWVAFVGPLTGTMLVVRTVRQS